MAETKRSEKQYIEDYIPTGAWVLIEKCETPKKVGSILLPDSTRDKNTKWTAVGRIVKMSPWVKFQDEWDEYSYRCYRVGDLVGFSATVPLMSPAPPFYAFGDSKVEENRLVTLHVTDILCVICETEAARREFAGRFNAASRNAASAS